MVISKLVFETRSKENGTDGLQTTTLNDDDGPSVGLDGGTREMEKRRRDKLGREGNESKFRRLSHPHFLNDIDIAFILSFSHFSCQNASKRNSWYLGEGFDVDKREKNYKLTYFSTLVLKHSCL